MSQFDDQEPNNFKLFMLQTSGIFLILVIVLAAFVFGPQNFERSAAPAQVTQKQKSEPVLAQEYTRKLTFKRESLSFQNQNNQKVEVPQTATKPIHIAIDTIGVDADISHPESPHIEALDQALTKGAVYYPGSGTIEGGNIFLFGHSTGFSVVRNQAYKTFNDLNTLNRGDEITITGEDGKKYVYAVDTVKLVDANSAFVELSNTGRTLTISTCNSFGQKSDRWVVDATFKEVRA